MLSRLRATDFAQHRKIILGKVTNIKPLYQLDLRTHLIMSWLVMQRANQGVHSAFMKVAAQRAFTTSPIAQDTYKSGNRETLNVHDLLARPTWSVSSLLPKNSDSTKTEISSKQLRHLLKLSALPPPKNDTEEQNMLATLSSQLHFVQEIQKADTTGVKPLQSLRDETAAGERDAELGLEALKDALAAEEVRGKFHRRIRRRRDAAGSGEAEEWNVLATAGKKTGRYFVVEGGKD